MDSSTTNKVSYQPYQVKPQKKVAARVEKSNAPIMGASCYQAEFPNWQNGLKDVYHEKQPQYPYYSLPFKGKTVYNDNFTEDQMKEQRRQQQITTHMGAKTSTLKYIFYYF